MPDMVSARAAGASRSARSGRMEARAVRFPDGERTRRARATASSCIVENVTGFRPAPAIPLSGAATLLRNSPRRVMNPIHIICDDDPARDSIARLVEDRLGEGPLLWRSADEFLAESDSIETAVLLVDLPGPAGLDLLHRIDGDPRFAAVLSTCAHDVGLAVELMRAGAEDLIAKPGDAEALLESIEAANARIETAEPVLAARRQIAVLSRRERDVLCGLVAGRPNKETARMLGISPRTIECYRASMMAKLGVASLAEALRIALAAGISPDADAEGHPANDFP